LRPAVALAISVVLLATSCTFIGGPPTGVNLNLRNQQLEVPTDQQLVLTFGQPVELRLLWQHFQLSPQTDGELGSGGDGRHFTFTPARAWLEATLFSVEVKPFHDLKGNPVSDHSWTFTTTIVPRVASFLDDAGVDLGPGYPVEQGHHVNLVFNTAMSQADTLVTANGQPAKLAWS